MLAISTPSVTDDGEGSLTPKQEDSHRRMASDDEEDMALTSKAFFSVKFETIHLRFVQFEAHASKSNHLHR